jgi:hypothetical protein
MWRRADSKDHRGISKAKLIGHIKRIIRREKSKPYVPPSDLSDAMDEYKKWKENGESDARFRLSRD